MGYVAVKGGIAAIEESMKLLRYQRLKGRAVLEVETVKNTMRGLIDQIMSEGSLYSRDLAALAIKQAEGNSEEATFLLRAYRSTLPRIHYSRTISSEEMRVERRISAMFKDIPGGQILGSSYDYTHRLLDFSLQEEDSIQIEAWLNDYNLATRNDREKSAGKLTKVIDLLRWEGVVIDPADDDQEPLDVTRESLQFPSGRSGRLQVLTRGQTGAVTALGYAAIRGYGMVHPTVGELRVGYLPLCIDDPLSTSKSADDAYYVGEIQVTEVETVIPEVKGKDGHKTIEFNIGYGICFGQNETKAIAMSILDYCLERTDVDSPVHDEEFVLLHIDCVEATGFISHLKLPHYVTFQSELDRVRKTKGGCKSNE
jgi:alpha-D-ribose 1-methylphosphonate 5-triphosphate synthase subunit PhnI